jgi:hypothetical protein
VRAGRRPVRVGFELDRPLDLGQLPSGVVERALESSRLRIVQLSANRRGEDPGYSSRRELRRRIRRSRQRRVAAGVSRRRRSTTAYRCCAGGFECRVGRKRTDAELVRRRIAFVRAIRSPESGTLAKGDVHISIPLIMRGLTDAIGVAAPRSDKCGSVPGSMIWIIRTLRFQIVTAGTLERVITSSALPGSFRRPSVKAVVRLQSEYRRRSLRPR